MGFGDFGALVVCLFLMFFVVSVILVDLRALSSAHYPAIGYRVFEYSIPSLLISPMHVYTVLLAE